ncbi:sodium channel modifier 1 isoform X2 [Corythoichthys intestinalis]|uniref:sodium channel modifier 1 isoform X2 n=1 Tax=Corythoichthys intestinalis TaxID=161448 RepID=UPI0025A63520|nr:sodium channel modifier 1 isoform X2 [Corythoichthys intestinalis]
MSFKREGDDKSQLNILKKRRVADLLSNFIPDDEATLLSNGRYTCLVCHFRPVFDTVDMLTVHRKGLKAFYGKKAQLKHEITKRKQEIFTQAEDQQQEGSTLAAPLLAQTRKLTHHALLKTGPYNSCHRKTSTKTEKAPANSKSLFQHTVPPCGIAESNKVLVPTESEKSTNTTRGRPLAASTSEPMSAQRRQELEHYLKLKSDGWLRDPSGRWVKDDNVEFDSDEDEPVSLIAESSGNVQEWP